MPRVDAFALPDLIPDGYLENKVAVVIDVLRATSTIACALANGARCVLPVVSVEDAREMKKTHGDALICGERGGVKPEGFTLGNSPIEYGESVVGGRSCVLTTTNGTRALHMVESAAQVLIGCVRNVDALVRELQAQDRDVVLVCSGTDGLLSFEDCYCAGMIIDRLGFVGSDSALLMYHAYVAATDAFDTPRFAIESSFHAKRLLELGFGDDIECAGEVGVDDLVPYYDRESGEIRVESN